ncbi:MAG: type II secretion system F family protein [Candidatus Omnitrophica bacterium]|nr:type II secretion system F family protein [Candidatus Omnitrophota bacterium]MDD5238346.1 type II secretion system F family protein [Candidatus Omnitrophota bacterium]
MSTYQYTAKDKAGKTIIGILEGASDSEVAETLHKRELIVLSVEQAKKKALKAGAKDRNVKLDDLLIFSRQLATMIDAGITLVNALGILAEQIESKQLRNVVTVVRQDIEAGMNFSDALAKHPAVFSELYINMTRAGETSGMLDEVLDRLASYLEKTAALTRKIKSSLIYPIVVVSIAILITAVLLLKVVPTFKGIFEMLGGSLPLPTQILIGISDLFRKYFLFVLIGLVAIVVLLKRYITTEKGRYNFDRGKLKAPVLGPLFRKVAVAKFSRTFSTLVKSGVSILNALEIVSKTAGNKVIEESVLNCAKSVRDGEPISKPLSKSGVFPPMVCRMISVGEQTGQLEKMLSKIADFYDEQVDAATSALTSLIEPMVITFLGVVIGGIVISLFLPIFKITQLISK